MCKTCGCDKPSGPDHHHHHHERERAGIIKIEENLLAKNDEMAGANRRYFAEHGLVCVNLLGSPGSGKTTLLEQTLGRLDSKVAVIEGDQYTDRDSRRIAATGVPVVQITTGMVCHLDASMVSRALAQLPIENRRLVFVENVGNLICPALFELGENCKVVLLSVPEGDDKPLKYPHMFRGADQVLLTKIDLLPHVSFDERQCEEYIQRMNPRARILRLSARSGEGMRPWYDWLNQQCVSTGK